jgi:hypothetical protein
MRVRVVMLTRPCAWVGCVAEFLGALHACRALNPESLRQEQFMDASQSERCPECCGTGQKVEMHPVVLGEKLPGYQQCPACNGAGRRVDRRTNKNDLDNDP